MRNLHKAFMAVLVLCLLVAASPALGGGAIYLDMKPAIDSHVNYPNCSGCIAIERLELAGQVITPASPWVVTPPPGTQSLTLTKSKDGTSAAFSAAFATTQNQINAARKDPGNAAKDLPGSLGPARIRLFTYDVQGAVRRMDEYRIDSVTISSFTSTGFSETIVLGFKTISLGSPSVKAPTPSVDKKPTPSPPPPPMKQDVHKRRSG